MGGTPTQIRTSLTEWWIFGHWLYEVAGPSFHAGLVLHPGANTIAFGERLWGVPISLLWS